MSFKQDLSVRFRTLVGVGASVGDVVFEAAAPIITSNGGGEAAAISIVENTTAVTTVTAVDLNLSTLVFSIIGGADAAAFAINVSTGVLTFVTAPNFEAPIDIGGNNVYNVIVQASDGVLVDTQSIEVTVTDVNEAPVITSNGGGASATISIVENTTAVTTVTSTDVDAGATKTYSISGGADAAKFTINAATGVLAFVTAPDFEVPTDVGANNVYNVTVQISDGTLVDTQAIAVTVTDGAELAAPPADAILADDGITYIMADDGITYMISDASVVAAGTEFGALTKASAGGVSISGSSITAGNAAGHWQVVANVLTPTATGDTADLNLGPYTLTFNDATTITLNTVASAYSVANIDQLIAVGILSTLTMGQQVLMRSGAYNPTYLDKRITRTAAVGGTFSGSNYVVFKPHTGAVCDLHRLGIYGTNFANCYFEFTGMRLVPAGAVASMGCLKLVNSASYFYLHDTTSNSPATAATDYATLSSFFYSATSTGSSFVRIENNVWDTCYNAIVASGVDMSIKGNTLTRMFEDAIKMVPPLSRLQVIGNTITNKEQAHTDHAVTAISRGATTVISLADVTGISTGHDVYFTGLVGCAELVGKYNITAVNTVAKTITIGVNSTAFSAYASGGVAGTTGVHGDFCQVSGTLATDGQLDDMVFRGNDFTRGAGTTGLNEGQGFFLQDNATGVFYRNLLIEGNIVESTMQSGISIQNPLNAIVRNNVVIQKLGHANYSNTTRISFAGAGTGNTCYDNVSNAYDFTATVPTQAGNLTIAAGELGGLCGGVCGPADGRGWRFRRDCLRAQGRRGYGVGQPGGWRAAASDVRDAVGLR